MMSLVSLLDMIDQEVIHPDLVRHIYIYIYYVRELGQSGWNIADIMTMNDLMFRTLIYAHSKEVLTDPLCNAAAHYRNASNIRRTSVGNKIVDRSDVVGASPVGAAPTTSSFLT